MIHILSYFSKRVFVICLCLALHHTVVWASDDDSRSEGDATQPPLLQPQDKDRLREVLAELSLEFQRRNTRVDWQHIKRILGAQHSEYAHLSRKQLQGFFYRMNREDTPNHQLTDKELESLLRKIVDFFLDDSVKALGAIPWRHWSEEFKGISADVLRVAAKKSSFAKKLTTFVSELFEQQGKCEAAADELIRRILYRLGRISPTVHRTDRKPATHDSVAKRVAVCANNSDPSSEILLDECLRSLTAADYCFVAFPPKART